MKRTLLLLGAAVLSASVLGGRNAEAQELSPKGQQIMDYLVADWSKHMHSTSIPLAMENLGLEPDDALRLEVGEYFREHTEIANNLKFWGANNYILSPEEKRIAKQLINIYDLEEELPTMEALVQELAIPKDRLRDRLGFLRDAGLLREAKGSPIGYELVRQYGRWGGPLRHNYHTITIGEDDPFDVWWAVDFLLVVTSEDYGDDEDLTFRLDDSCAHCSRKISIEIKNGQITSVDPEEPWVQQGGGWAVDNLFWSEEHLRDWLNDNPAYRNLNHASIGDFFEQLKERHDR